MIAFLKSNPHINRFYISIPHSRKYQPKELEKQIISNPSVRQKLKSIPSSEWFWNNHF